MSERDSRPRVVITAMNRYSYYQWFLLGFHYLEREGRIRLKFRVRSLYEMLSFVCRGRVLTGFRRIAVKHGISWRWLFKFTNTLEGYVERDGRRHYFCIDSNDNPFTFDSELLESVSVYFKMQCPKEFREEGFYLTDEVVIPWLDQNIEHMPRREKTRKPCSNLMSNVGKVRPLMIGTRLMSRGNAFRWLDESFRGYERASCNKAEKALMCYFGNAQGPRPERAEPLDLDREEQIMGYFGDRVSHPNEKRARAARIIRGLGDGCDARVIDETEPGFKARVTHPEQVVPIERFCDHISRFRYNLNISGYGMSIPNRFVESFLVGTAIVTDKLQVRWYRPFGAEVAETVAMGYRPMDSVDWERFESDLQALPKVEKAEVLEAFNEKWHPKKAAEYILDEVLKSETDNVRGR